MYLHTTQELHAPTATPMARMVAATIGLRDALLRFEARNTDADSPLDPAGQEELVLLFERWSRCLERSIGVEAAVDEEFRRAAVRWVRDQVQPFVLRSEIGYRAIRKPAGFAGDHETIQLVYRQRPAGRDRVGRLIDAVVLAMPMAQAVFNRRRLLAEEIRRTRATCDRQPVRITSLACGPAEELRDVLLPANPGRVPLSVTLVDIDPTALEYARGRLEATGAGQRIRARRCNLIKAATGRRPLELPAQDLVYSAGLIDYFEDDLVVGLIDAAHGWLAPGGRLILGNFHPRNPDRAFLDHVTEWPLIYRTEADMDRLFERSRFGRPCTKVAFEPRGINLFAECVRS